MVKAQEWLDREYPKKERENIREIYLNGSSLEGELDLGDFTCENLKVYVYAPVEEKKLTWKNLPILTDIIRCERVQKFIDRNYPTKNNKEEAIELNLFIKT